MKKDVGKVLLPRDGTTLRYYVFGSMERGFGVQIIQSQGDQVLHNAARGNLTKDWQSAHNFGRTLARGVVFPDNLNEVCDDFELELLFDS